MDLEDKVRSKLRQVTNPNTGKKYVFDLDHFYAALRAVQFVLGCRVTKVSIHVAQTDCEDGKEASWFYKCKLAGKLPDESVKGAPLKRVVRTVTVTKDPLAQILRKEGDFDWKKSALVSAALHDLVPKEQWDALAQQLKEWTVELDGDVKSQDAFKKRLEAVRNRIFQKDREALTFEMARLQRQGWKLRDVVECWNEALVKGVMEA